MKKIIMIIFIVLSFTAFSKVYIKNGYLNFVVENKKSFDTLKLVFDGKTYNFFYINRTLKCYLKLPRDGIYSFYYLEKNKRVLENSILQDDNKNVIYIINGELKEVKSFFNTYFATEKYNKLSTYFEKNDIGYLYDVSLYGNFDLISPYFTFNSIYDFGYSNGAYAYFSFMSYLGNKTLNLGYKNTVMTGSGYYLKYYKSFFEKKYFFSIRDFSGADRVSKNEYLIIPVYFFNYDDFITMEYRAYEIPTNIGSIYAVIGDDFKVGMLWSSKEQAKLNYLCPETEKEAPLLIFYAGNDDLSLNFGYYNYSEPYYLATKSIVKNGLDTYYYYFNVDFLKKGLTVYFTMNWIPEIYTYVNYSDELWGFMNLSYNIYLKNLRIYPLLQLYYYNKETKIHFKIYGEVKTKIGLFKGGIGTTTYNTVWDGWTIKNEDNNNIKFNINYEYTF